MKQVIFLCLLSLTVCFSKPAETQASTSQDDVKSATTAVKPAETSQAAQIPPHIETQSSPNDTTIVKPTLSTNVISTQSINQTSLTVTPTSNLPETANKEHTQLNNTTKKEEAAAPKGSESNNTAAASTATSTGTKPASTVPIVAPNNESKPVENKDTNNGTSTQPAPKPSDPKVTPKADDDQHIVQARGFDGPSFMGGIILTLGLLAIGFMGFKYYKNQTERNYHTL